MCSLGTCRILRARSLSSLGSGKALLGRGGDKTQILLVRGSSRGGIFAVKFHAPPSSDAKIPRVVRRSILYKSGRFPIGSPFMRLIGNSLGAFLGTVACPSGAMCPITDYGSGSFRGLVRICVSTMFCPGVCRRSGAFHRRK